MEDICLYDFIKKWVTPGIKWKILSYLLSREELKINNIPEHNYSFSRNVLPGRVERFHTGKKKYLYYYFPFQNDKTKITRWNPCPEYVKNTLKRQNSVLKISKTTTTKITPENIKRIKDKMQNKDHYWEYPEIIISWYTKKNISLDFCKLDIENATHFEYKNCTELQENKEGLFWNLVQNIIIVYPPHNNGCRRQYNIYFNIYYHSLTISPLHFLWRIKHQKINLSHLKEIASLNQIKGRSKLKTYKDYLQVFTKL